MMKHEARGTSFSVTCCCVDRSRAVKSATSTL